MIPDRLEDWTYAKIQELVKNGINESERHDFKSGLPPAIDLTKDCCAFANSKDGFIILGIGESGKNSELKESIVKRIWQTNLIKS